MSQRKPTWKTVTGRLYPIPDMKDHELHMYLKKAEQLYETKCKTHMKAFGDCERIMDEIEAVDKNLRKQREQYLQAKAALTEKKELLRKKLKNKELLLDNSEASTKVFRQKVREIRAEFQNRNQSAPDSESKLVKNMLKVNV